MLVRIVRMTFRPEALPRFHALFEDAAPQIRATEGCLHLELWEDARFSNILTTYSHWRSPAALAAYRDGDLFRTTWAATRPLFAAPPEAHSYHPTIRIESPTEG